MNTICVSFLLEILQGGIHRSEDNYKLALFTEGADLDQLVGGYSTFGEVKGSGYTAGGKSLPAPAFNSDEFGASMDFGQSVTWDPCSVTARFAMIYNASRQNRAVAVIDDGASRTSSNGPFEVPLRSSTGPLIRLAISRPR